MLRAEEETKDSWHVALQDLAVWWEEKGMHIGGLTGRGEWNRSVCWEFRMGETVWLGESRTLENILKQMNGYGSLAGLCALGMIVGEWTDRIWWEEGLVGDIHSFIIHSIDLYWMPTARHSSKLWGLTSEQDRKQPLPYCSLHSKRGRRNII